MKRMILISLMLAFVANITQAGPLLWRDPKTINKGSFIVMAGFGYNKQAKVWNDTNETWDALTAKQRVQTISSMFMLGYGLFKNFEILSYIPVLKRDRDTLHSFGQGDVWFKAKYCVLNKKGLPTVALLAATRLPVSDKNARPLLDDHSLDFAFGAKAATPKYSNFVGHLKVGYWLNGNDTTGTVNLGDEIEAIIKIDYWFMKTAFFFLNAEYVQTFKNKDSTGTDIPNTDKNSLVLTPGLTIKPVTGLTLRPKIGVPIYALSKGGRLYPFSVGLDVWYIK